MKDLNKSYLRIRRGSGLKLGGTAIIGAAPPKWGPPRIFLPEASYDVGPPWSLNICIATSGGAGTKGPKGLWVVNYLINQSLSKTYNIRVHQILNQKENEKQKPTQHQVQASTLVEEVYLRQMEVWLALHKNHTLLHHGFPHQVTVFHWMGNYQAYLHSFCHSDHGLVYYHDHLSIDPQYLIFALRVCPSKIWKHKIKKHENPKLNP